MAKKYLFMLESREGEWTMLTQGGRVLTTTEPMPGSPKVVFSDKTPFPSIDWIQYMKEVEHDS